jgi:hypothetical protein
MGDLSRVVSSLQLSTMDYPTSKQQQLIMDTRILLGKTILGATRFAYQNFGFIICAVILFISITHCIQGVQAIQHRYSVCSNLLFIAIIYNLQVMLFIHWQAHSPGKHHGLMLDHAAFNGVIAMLMRQAFFTNALRRNQKCTARPAALHPNPTRQPPPLWRDTLWMRDIPNGMALSYVPG